MYEAATISDRQRVHTALAKSLTGEEQVDRRVWHLAMATLIPDEEVATALETSARRSERRAAWAAGQTDRARDAIARLLPGADDGLRAELLHLGGTIDARTGRLYDAYTKLVTRAELSTDPELTLELLLEAAETAPYTGDLDSVRELPKRGATIKADSPRARMMVGLLQGWAMALV